MNDENHKWSCTTCSYANWPLARKCTLCLTPKENVIDVETGKVKAELIQPPSNKWTCKVYLHTNCNTVSFHLATDVLFSCLIVTMIFSWSGRFTVEFKILFIIAISSLLRQPKQYCQQSIVSRPPKKPWITSYHNKTCFIFRYVFE